MVRRQPVVIEGRRRLSRRLADRIMRHYTDESRETEGRAVAHHLYGAILVLAVLITADEHGTHPMRTAIVLAATVAVLLGMESYADLIAREIALRRELVRTERAAAVRQLFAVTAAAEVPLIFLLLAGVDILSEELAFTLAEATTVGVLFYYGYLARELAGRGHRDSLISGLTVAAIGIVLALGKGYVHV